MNSILYNISLILLGVGIILTTVYITRTFTINNLLTEQQKLNYEDQDGLRRKNPIDVIYDYKVSKAYKKMFLEPSIWMGYSDFDQSDSTDKIYVKN